jgi:peptide/nickel transport system permease protein
MMTHHVLGNIFISIATYLGPKWARLLGGTVFIESVFTRSGSGRFIINTIAACDFPEVQMGVLFTPSAYAVLNLAVDCCNNMSTCVFGKYCFTAR